MISFFGHFYFMVKSKENIKNNNQSKFSKKEELKQVKMNFHSYIAIFMTIMMLMKNLKGAIAGE